MSKLLTLRIFNIWQSSLSAFIVKMNKQKHSPKNKEVFYVCNNNDYETFARPVNPKGVDQKSAYLVGSDWPQQPPAFGERRTDERGAYPYSGELSCPEAPVTTSGAHEGHVIIRGGREGWKNHFEMSLGSSLRSIS